MAQQFVHLVFARAKWVVVTYEGETHRAFAASAGDGKTAVYEEHYRERLTAEHLSAQSAWDQHRAEIERGAEISSETVKEGSLGSRQAVTYTTVAFADGKVVRSPNTEPSQIIKSRVFDTIGERPSGAPVSSFHERATATEDQGWEVWLYSGNSARSRIDLATRPAPHGTPLYAITFALNRFGAAGWSVVTVSEDKGLFSNDFTYNQAVPTRIRYLLTADAAATVPTLEASSQVT